MPTLQNRQAAFKASTWTRGELVIAVYLIDWALSRIHQQSRRKSFEKARRQVQAELKNRDAAIVARWLHQMKPTHLDAGLRMPTLTRILARIIERQAF